MPQRVFPRDPRDAAWLFDRANRRNPRVKLSQLEALMEAAPHEEPSPTYADVPSNPTKPWVLLLVEAVIDGLSEEEQEIVGVLVMEKLSLRVAGKILNIPKSTLARRRDKIWKKIEKELLAYPEVWEYINGNWNPRRRNPS